MSSKCGTLYVNGCSLETVSSPSSFKCLVKRRYSSRLVLLILFLMLTFHVRGTCFVPIRVIAINYSVLGVDRVVCVMLFEIFLVKFGKVPCMVL